jgi:phenylalanyl-tRNA synthetase beta chain
MSSLFIEATGTDLDQVLLTLNILAANLSDRGWTILPVTAEYPYDTPHGRMVTAPHLAAISQAAPLEMLNRLLGEKLQAEDVAARLMAYGLKASVDGEIITATAPSYRQDYLHPVDLMEDFAISRGFSSFAPLLPGDFTVGRLPPLTALEDLLRDLMIGLGFEEGICNILTGVELLRRRMQVEDTPEGSFAPFHGGPGVRIQNVMNANYAVLRDWILPSLLEIESHSEGAVYPHRIFEVGEVAVYDLNDNLGSRTESRLAALMAEEAASFDSVQSVLYALLNALKISFKVSPCSHPSMIPGRAALVTAGEQAEPLAFLGEFSPRVLTHWGTRVPAAGLELSVTALQRLLAMQL